jgi:hypothetical protein
MASQSIQSSNIGHQKAIKLPMPAENPHWELEPETPLPSSMKMQMYQRP